MNSHLDIRVHARQAAHAASRALYEERLAYWRALLWAFEKGLEALRTYANGHLDDHPTLKREVNAFIRACEYGLTALGPFVSLLAVEKALEHFMGRKVEKVSRLEVKGARVFPKNFYVR